jgi:ABC-type Zn2+ transport system substrate-binding protein/surface adhesin
MSMSAFFRALRASYQAEIDDLSFDSEGRDVLRHRLEEKRGQVLFLKQMMDLSPEMVATVFHKGFHFVIPAAMEHVLTLEPDEFPEWGSLSDAVQLAPWAKDLADVFLTEPQGEWFMVTAAALEYLYQRAPAQGHDESHEEHGEDAQASHRQRDHDHGHDFDRDDAHNHASDHDHEESSADWLEQHGFDRKE